MTDKTKKILSKLHFTSLVLSLLLAILFSLFILVCQTHDSFVKYRAIECVNLQFDSEYFKKFKISFKQDQQSNLAIKGAGHINRLVELETTSGFGTILRRECGTTRSSDGKTIPGWWTSELILPMFAHDDYSWLSSDRQLQLIYLAILWAIPALLLGAKKWLLWLLK